MDYNDLRNVSYNYIIKKFGELELKDYFSLLYKSAERFIESLELESYLIISNRQLVKIGIDYHADIGRLIDFHNIEIDKIQPTKVAAYTAYWVVKNKPLQLIQDLSKEKIAKYPYIQDINELFACSLLISLAFDTRKPIVLSAPATGRWNNFTLCLQYSLAYRIITPQALELVLDALNVKPFYKPLLKPIQVY